MEIGEKIKNLRTMLGLTQEDLADRAELSKGFISQVERNLTSPSIATLMDILQCLGSNLKDFFNDEGDDQIVFAEEDTFEKEHDEGAYTIRWLIPGSQKNMMEPIIVTLQPGREIPEHTAHEGEEFGYVLSGSITIYSGNRVAKAKKGEAFSFSPGLYHKIANHSKSVARFLWIATPPSF